MEEEIQRSPVEVGSFMPVFTRVGRISEPSTVGAIYSMTLRL